MEVFQPIRISGIAKEEKRPPRFRWWPQFVFMFFCIGIVLLIYFFAPLRTNILILGVDSGLERGDLGRSDTIILATISPLEPTVRLLSIPRDLWLPVPGVGENRINTAYFFAEAETPGSGPDAAANVIELSFHVPVNHTIVLQMDGLVGIIDAMGGVDITLEKASSGYPAGTFHLNGVEALAFARSRSGSDDFARMSQGQTLLKAAMRQILQPDHWARWAKVQKALNAAVTINIPLWQWPRLALALLRAGSDGIETRSITRDMVTPFTTNQGAQVLAPNWAEISPLIDEMFLK